MVSCTSLSTIAFQWVFLLRPFSSSSKCLWRQIVSFNATKEEPVVHVEMHHGSLFVSQFLIVRARKSVTVSGHSI